MDRNSFNEYLIFFFYFTFFFHQSRSRQDETQRPVTLREPPEISWENTLGAPNGVPFDDETKALLRDCLGVSMPPPTTLAELLKRSDAFPIPFPINTPRCSALKSRGIGTDILEVRTTLYILYHFNWILFPTLNWII